MTPQVGDILYVDKNTHGKRVAHHAMVVKVDEAKGQCWTVDGNSGPSPGVVGQLKQCTIKHPRYAFFSIQKLVDRAREREQA